MNLFETYEHLMRFELERMVSAGTLPAVDFARVTVGPTRDPAHGDIVTNAALVAASAKDPQALAKVLARHFHALPDVLKAEAAENGFVNLRLKPTVWHRAVIAILHGGADRNLCSDINYSEAEDWSVSDAVFNIRHTLTVGCAVLRHAGEEMGFDVTDEALSSASFERLADPGEMALMTRLAGSHHALVDGGKNQAALYLAEVATAFRAVYGARQADAVMGLLSRHDRQLSLARVALVRATMLVLATGIS